MGFWNVSFLFKKGTARRGEDGDSSKNRRQPKAVKPKKISKVEGHFIVHASCNNGTSALVTNTGKLIMLGKDTTHCDSNGFVTDILDQHITKVALGKAHTVALNSKGQIYTFGMNNKGQCGRAKGKAPQGQSEMDFGAKQQQQPSAASQQSSPAAAATIAPPPPPPPQHQHPKPSLSNLGPMNSDLSLMCDVEDHNLVHGQCRVCMHSIQLLSKRFLNLLFSSCRYVSFVANAPATMFLVYAHKKFPLTNVFLERKYFNSFIVLAIDKMHN